MPPVRILAHLLTPLLGLAVASGCVTPAASPAPAAAPASAKSQATSSTTTSPEVTAAAPGSPLLMTSPCRPGEDLAAGDDPGKPQVEAGLTGNVDGKTGKVTRVRSYVAHRCP